MCSLLEAHAHAHSSRWWLIFELETERITLAYNRFRSAAGVIDCMYVAISVK